MNVTFQKLDSSTYNSNSNGAALFFGTKLFCLSQQKAELAILKNSFFLSWPFWIFSLDPHKNQSRAATANFNQPRTPVKGRHNLLPLVEIELRWLPKLGKDQSLASLAAVAALQSQLFDRMDGTQF